MRWLEVDALALIKVLARPLSWQRGYVLKEERDLVASWQTVNYLPALARVTEHRSR